MNDFLVNRVRLFRSSHTYQLCGFDREYKKKQKPGSNTRTRYNFQIIGLEEWWISTFQKFSNHFMSCFRKDLTNGGFGFTFDILRLTLSLRKSRRALEDYAAGDGGLRSRAQVCFLFLEEYWIKFLIGKFRKQICISLIQLITWKVL